MTPVNADFDEKLRRVLHAEADLIEPAGGGLDRIRQRAHAPWLVRQASLMLTECVDLAWLIVIRLEPHFTRARAAIADRGGAWQAFVGVLSSTVSILAGLVTPSRRVHSAHQAGRGGPPRSRARAGSGLSWLRPALAVAAAVIIVVAGVFGLAQVRDNLVLELFPSNNPPASTSTSSSGNGHQVPTLTGQTPTGIVPPATTPTGSAKPRPKTTCSSAPSKQQATPNPTATVTPTPTVSSSPTVTPTPTDTTTPTPTASTGAAQTAAGTATAVSIQTVANVAPASTLCTSAKPHSTPAS